MARRVKFTQVEQVRSAILKKQGNKCPLCGGSLTARSKKAPALDHDHSTGYLRGVLCINCNGIEGKVFNLVRRAKGTMTTDEWLNRLLAYYEVHRVPQHGGLFHPTHKTEEEKRLARNAKARKKRAALKKE